MTAVTVREHGTEKFSKVLRFMYTVPTGVQETLDTWIAVSKKNGSMERTLFQRSHGEEAEAEAMKDIAENAIRENCDVLTIGQRCADWFVLRQFRVTGTKAGIILMSNGMVRSVLGLPLVEASEDRTTAQWFDLFYRGWFSVKVSTEAMMRGSANENAVTSALRAMPFVKEVFDVGMVGMKEALYLACSPDGIALMDIHFFEDWEMDEDGQSNTEGETVVLASVEIKTRVAPSSLGESLSLSSADIVRCEVGDETFRQYIPLEHMAQVLHQLVVLRLRFVIYIASAETGIMYTVIARCSEVILQLCKDVLTDTAGPIVEWAYESNFSFPDFVHVDCRQILRTRHKFWQVIEQHVKNTGCFVPIKLFKHAAQSFYSKTKAGVDGATQQRAILRSSTSHFKWEQKIVSQTIKTLAVNAFFGWRMFERQDLLESSQTFRSLDNYRNLLNKVQATADFMFDVSQDLLSYAATTQIEERGGEGAQEEITAGEVNRLIGLAHSRKKKRLGFFNSEEGTVLRLSVRGHTPKQGPIRYCTLCGQNSGAWRGHRSTYSCQLCGVHLCVRTYVGLRKSCWSVWHSAKELKLRSTPNPNPPVFEENENINGDEENEDGDRERETTSVGTRSSIARLKRGRSGETDSSSVPVPRRRRTR